MYAKTGKGEKKCVFFAEQGEIKFRNKNWQTHFYLQKYPVKIFIWEKEFSFKKRNGKTHRYMYVFPPSL